MILFPIVGVLAIVVAVLAMMAISFSFNALLGTRQESSHPRQRRWGFIWLAALPVLGLVVLLGAFSKNTWQHQSPAVVENVARSDRSGVKGLSEARFELQKTNRALAGIVSINEAAIIESSVDEPAVPSVEAADNGTAAAASHAIADPADEKTAEEKTPPIETPTPKVSEEELQKQRSELGTDIGQWIRSLLDETSGSEAAGTNTVGQAAQSADGDVVVLQLSDQGAEQLLGQSAHAMLKSMNSELPSRIRQTYALISLTPSVEAGVAPVNPVLAAGGLKAIANSIGAIIARSQDPDSSSIEQRPVEVAVVADEPPGESPFPKWLKNPDGGRIVVETEFAPVGEDTKVPLLAEVNKAWIKHLADFADSLEPTIQKQAGFVKLELDAETAESCIVQTFERIEDLQTAVEGQKTMHKMYALVEFPESVDKVAVQEMRLSAQHDRVASLGILVVFLWLAVTSAGCGVRLRSHSSRLMRFSSFAVFAGLTLPIVLIACGFTVALARGETPRRPWMESAAVVKIHVD